MSRDISLRQPFLTERHPQADVKGSVDPMGATPIWSRMGRRVVGTPTRANHAFCGVGGGCAGSERHQERPEASPPLTCAAASNETD